MVARHSREISGGRMKNIVALLESMWGWGGYNEPGAEAPRFFRINPDNHSGRRLYRLCGDANLIVTNCCKIVQRSANHHGTPDTQWVRENLIRAVNDGADLILVCGRVAKETFATVTGALMGTDGLAYIGGSGSNVFKWYAIDHPAARRWSNEKLENSRLHIERLLCRESV